MTRKENSPTAAPGALPEENPRPVASSSVLPYIPHPVDEAVARVILEEGTVTELSAGDWVVPPNRPIQTLVLVLSGLVARQAGSLAGPIGLSPAGRFACGHLNIFTHHPAIGSYSALTPCRVASVPQDAFRSKLARDPALLRLFAAQCELFTLSDRLGLGTVTLLQVRARVCAFLIAWARSFGRLARTSPSDPGWFVVPAPPAGCVCRIVHSTPEYVADVTEEWRKRGLAASNGAEWAVHTPVLRETFEWLTRARGPAELPLPGLFEETAASILEAEAPAWIPRSV